MRSWLILVALLLLGASASRVASFPPQFERVEVKGVIQANKHHMDEDTWATLHLAEQKVTWDDWHLLHFCREKEYLELLQFEGHCCKIVGFRARSGDIRVLVVESFEILPFMDVPEKYQPEYDAAP
jgi:hypothetical protein